MSGGAWTEADLDRLSPQQIRALTNAGELDDLLKGEPPSQADADQVKRQTLLDLEEAADE